MFPENDSEKIKLKHRLRQHCMSVLENRIAVAQAAMNEAQEAANSEEKSSAGDKYETSRAMGQLGRDMNAKQLEEARRDLAFINSLEASRLTEIVTTCSVVICTQKTFFISLGLGTASIGEREIIFISPSAPVAGLISGKKAGQTFIFNREETEILAVF